MRKVVLITVGTLKERYWIDALQEYTKRISKFFDFEIIEIPEHKLNEKPNESNILKVLSNEGIRIKEKIKSNNVCCLCIEGKEMSSVQFASFIEKTTNQGTLYFVIGGSYGIDESVKSLGSKLSFGQLTYPHQMMRVIFSEQLYRAGTILNNIEYHK